MFRWLWEGRQSLGSTGWKFHQLSCHRCNSALAFPSNGSLDTVEKAVQTSEMELAGLSHKWSNSNYAFIGLECVLSSILSIESWKTACLSIENTGWFSEKWSLCRWAKYFYSNCFSYSRKWVLESSLHASFGVCKQPNQYICLKPKSAYQSKSGITKSQGPSVLLHYVQPVLWPKLLI